MTRLRRGAILLVLAMAVGCARAPEPARVILLALDGLDPRAVDLLAGSGEMPHLARLRKEGAYAPLASQEPLLSPVIWTTIATGKTEHGITHFVTVDPTSGEQRPVTSRSRKVKAIWNIASGAGREVAVVGWWATWPAEKVRGAIVSDHVSYHFMSREGFAKASDPSGLTHPPELLGEIAPLIRGSRDLAPDEILRFAKVGPEALMRPFDFHDPLEHLKWALASAETSRRVGRFLWERQRPDLLMVYVEGTDSVSHLFGHLFRAKPLFTGLLLQQRRYGQTVEEMYRWADRLVGEYLKLLDERTTLVVVSDHGFRLGELPDDPSEAGRPVGHKYHRLEGVLYLYGYGVKPGATLDRPTVLDLTPTLLALLGIPAAGDMPGRVLAEALTLPVPAPVSTHEGGPPHSVDDGASPGSSVDAEIVERLRALGYVGDGSPGGDVNAAQGLFDAGHFEEAARAYEKLVGAHPKDPALRVSLAAALGSLGRSREAQAQLDVALQLDSLNAAAYFNRGALREAKGEQGAAVVDYRNALRCRPGFKPGADALKRLTGSESASPPRDGAERRAFALAGEAAELAQRGAYAEANRKLDEAVRAAPRYAPVHQYRANVAYLKGDRAAAVAALRRALQLEPDNVVVEENLRRLESGR